MLDYNVVSLFVFLSFSSKTKRRHPSFRHNSCFCSHFFKKDDVVLPFVLTHTAQPLHENIINIALSICIMRTVPPRLQFFPFFLHSYPGWFLSFSLQLPAGFHDSLAWFWSCRSRFFSASIQRRQQLLCLLSASYKMTWREQPHHHLMAGILSLTQMARMRC